MLGSGEKFDLLFTDVVMPDGMSGYDLAAAARLRQPRLKVLFTTGYAAELSTNDGQFMLAKPYQKRDLAWAIRNALDGSRPPSGLRWA